MELASTTRGGSAIPCKAEMSRAVPPSVSRA
jgi:hypothetical protein